MRNVQKLATVAVATCGILFAGIGGASADTRNGDDNEGDNIPVLSDIHHLDWDHSPFCGIQINTEDSKQKTSCPAVHQENTSDSPVYIVTFGS
ncbi:hypothetical protein ACIHCX_37185 [Streptomyces sp. NPDC052043]|uniref:hypothetical protein n=1 Tax=Streptomyces sp. NPDC052043 TaxID=3365684 RepID=UPI0037D36282